MRCLLWSPKKSLNYTLDYKSGMSEWITEWMIFWWQWQWMILWPTLISVLFTSWKVESCKVIQNHPHPPPLPSPLNIAAVTAATDVIDLLVYSTVGEHVESLMKTLSNLTSFSPWLKRSDLPIGAGRLLAHDGSVGRTPFLLQLNHDMYRR